MHSSGINYFLFTKITNWTSGQVISRAAILTSLVKKLINIRSCSIKAFRNTGVRPDEDNAIETGEQGGAGDALANQDCGAPAHGGVIMNFIRAFTGFNCKSYDLGASQTAAEKPDTGGARGAYTPLELLTDRPITREKFITQAVKLIIAELNSGPMKQLKDKIAWQSQEFEVYIPAQINRLIDHAGAALDNNGKALLFPASPRREIIIQTLDDMGVLARYAHVKNLAGGAQTSISHMTRNFLATQGIHDAQLISHISHQVYETLFAAPGQVAQAIRTAERVIEQRLSNESAA
ncbi:hypothetical protein ACL2XP_18810 [Sodalis sp. RH21]|uniref:hypothetical protein n=1 Tax=unclassified Sodalis (in: enterobacteria) TaxID=2636512 RepID=UPI0039B5A69B